MKARKTMGGEDRYRRLLESVDSLDLQELQAAWDARIKAVQVASTELGATVTAAKKAAIEDFEAVLVRLEARYFPETVQPTGSDRFKNRKQAWDWLCSQGYKISRSKFYQDCDEGFPAIGKDGSVSKFSVLQYGQQVDVETRVSSGSVFEAEKKNRLELRKLELEIEEKERKARIEDSRWMRVDDHWAQVMVIINALRGNLEHYTRIDIGRLIMEAGGDYNRGPIVSDKIIELIINRSFNDLSGMRVDSGLFEKIEEDEHEQQ